MEANDKVLDMLKKAGKPMKISELAEESGLDKNDDPICLRFGHGALAADKAELENIASKLRSGLNK